MDAANYGCKKSNGGVEQKMVNATHSRTQNGVVGGRTDRSMGIHGMSKIAQLYGKCRKLKQFTCRTCVGGGCNVNASHQRVKLACNPGVLARLLIPGFSSNHEF